MTAQAPAPPPWNWSGLTAPERRSELGDLADWVEGLLEAHGHWVRLLPAGPATRPA